MGDGFPFIPAWFDDMKLTPQQFRIACRIARRVDCCESARSISSSCGISRQTTLNGLSKLREIGLISEHKDRSGRTFWRLENPNSTGLNQGQEGGSQIVHNGLNGIQGGSQIGQSGLNEIPKGTTPIKVTPCGRS